jgi:hypothetical protein
MSSHVYVTQLLYYRKRSEFNVGSNILLERGRISDQTSGWYKHEICPAVIAEISSIDCIPTDSPIMYQSGALSFLILDGAVIYNLFIK